MEGAAFEVQGLARLSHTLITRAQATEVLRAFRSHIHSELHDDSAAGLAPDRHVEKNGWVTDRHRL